MPQLSTSARFSERLRDATRTAHQDAEAAAFAQALLDGRVPRAGYTALVAQHWFIYSALEEAAAAMRNDPVAGGFVDDRLARVPALADDLAYLLGPDWRDQIAPTPATQAYRERLREVAYRSPTGFIAHHYTRYLGDLSGGQAIGRVVTRAYELADGRGAAFYDFRQLGPIGAYKRRYRERLDALPYDEAELGRLVDEVLVAYRLNSDLFADLRPTLPNPFPPEVIEAITRHMNDDHAEDALLIVRTLGGRPDATAVRMTGLDGTGLDFDAETTGGTVPVRVRFAQPVTARHEVRPAVVLLYEKAKQYAAALP